MSDKYMYEIRLNSDSYSGRLLRRTPFRECAFDEAKLNGGGTVYEYVLKHEASQDNLETWERTATFQITVEKDSPDL